jgi:hypothetical protein
MSNLFSIQERKTLKSAKAISETIFYPLSVYISKSFFLPPLTFFSKLWQDAELSLWKTEEGDDERYRT